MLKKAAALFLVCASIATWTACGKTSSHYVYATIPQANQILAYREDPNSGVLTPLAGSPFATGTAPETIALHPSRKFLYVANSGPVDNNISLFKIASNGALTEVTPRTPTGGTTPMLLAMDAVGGFLYTANAGSQDISVFSIDSSSGALTVVPQPGPTAPVGISPSSMKLSSSGTILYVSGGPGSSGLIEVFSVSAGVLSAIGSVQTGGANPTGLVIDQTNSFLYTANFGSNSIAEFTIQSDGSLSTLPTFPTSGSLTSPIALLIDSSGKFLYAANDAPSGTLTAYSIDAGGGLTVLTNSPFGTSARPNSLVADPSDKYLLVGTQGGGAAIQVFSLNASNGTLSSLATYSAGNTVTSIVVIQ